ncbi:hypothetical protein EJ04DRAFT_136407 [Polyplosphaeria fusca]|uniref:Uncharacterized protein n=1 Tax=Polyplosphaeria fusca TaxID=682080 RepID=A0A9P4QML0_9PLEO|nr:hypothetical protein EJ04DRAFT_136407 [Polyplosphaeria fusca]
MVESPRGLKPLFTSKHAAHSCSTPLKRCNCLTHQPLFPLLDQRFKLCGGPKHFCAESYSGFLVARGREPFSWPPLGTDQPRCSTSRPCRSITDALSAEAISRCFVYDSQGREAVWLACRSGDSVSRAPWTASFDRHPSHLRRLTGCAPRARVCGRCTVGMLSSHSKCSRMMASVLSEVRKVELRRGSAERSWGCSGDRSVLQQRLAIFGGKRRYNTESKHLIRHVC